jgi:spore coat protein U-like protein
MQRSNWKKLAVVCGFGLGLSMMSGEQAEAASTPASLDVTANVVAVCNISVASVAFGQYDVTSLTPLTAAGSVSVNCTTGAPYSVTFNQGLNPAGSSTVDAPERQMANQTAGSTDVLAYSLSYGGSPIGGSALSDIAGTGNGASQTYTIDGSIPSGQAVGDGAYLDTVVATVNY